MLRISLKNLDIFLIYILIVATSWEAFMPNTWLDEIILLLLCAYKLFVVKKNDVKIIKILVFYIVWCTIGILLNYRFSMYSFYSIFDSLKPILYLSIFSCTSIDAKQAKNYFNFFYIVNIPSVLIGIINYVKYNYLGEELLFQTGTLKYVNGIIIHRAGGGLGHSGVFSSLCMELLVLTLFLKERGICKYVLMMIFCVGLLVGRGRIAFAFFWGGIVFYAFIKLPRKYQKYVLLIVFLFIILAIYPSVVFFQNAFQYDMENQIRFWTWGFMLDIIDKVLFCGLGIGSVGNSNSMLYNVDIYKLYDIVNYGTRDWESHLAKQLIQTGVVGTVIWYMPFFWCVKAAIKNKSNYSHITIFMLIYFLLNSIINKAYEMPFFIILGILLSVTIVERENNNKKEIYT